MAVVLATKTAEVNKRSTNLYHAHTKRPKRPQKGAQQLLAGSPWQSPPRAPTDPDVPDSGIRLVNVREGGKGKEEKRSGVGCLYRNALHLVLQRAERQEACDRSRQTGGLHGSTAAAFCQCRQRSFRKK